MKKGRILFRTYSFCCKDDFLSVNLISLRDYFSNEIVLIASCLKVRFENFDIVIE